VKIVITGGAGFIGANLARTLRDQDAEHELVAVDDLSTGFADNLDGIEDVDLRVGTILDEDFLNAACAGADAIVHLAARPSVPRSVADPVASHDANATGTVRVLEAARSAGGAQVIVASSSSVYGGNPTLPKHEDLAPAPLSPYAASKLATESYALAYRHCYGMPVVAFRFFNVFGPLQAAGHAYAAVIPAFLDAALAGRPIPVHGDGGQTRDFTYVGTVCAVIADAIERKVGDPKPVNLAFGTRRSLLEVIDKLEGILGRPLEREHQPSRAGDVRDSQADQSRVRALFHAVEPIDFDEGLAATVDWFRTSRDRVLG
jgi:UDP-glucose 4-epimerase